MADIARPSSLSTGIAWRDMEFPIVLNGTVSLGDPIGQDATGWIRADADAPVPCLAFALAAGVSGDRIKACKRMLLVPSTDMTIATPVFLSATAGRIADANVGGSAVIMQCLGWVVEGTVHELIYLDSELQHYRITKNLSGTEPATAGNHGYIFTAGERLQFLGGWEVHGTAGTDGGAVTVDLEKLTSGTAKGSGVSMTGSTWNLKATAATPVFLGPSATAANTRLLPRDSVALLLAGTPTAVADMALTAIFVKAQI